MILLKGIDSIIETRHARPAPGGYPVGIRGCPLGIRSTVTKHSRAAPGQQLVTVDARRTAPGKQGGYPVGIRGCPLGIRSTVTKHSLAAPGQQSVTVDARSAAPGQQLVTVDAPTRHPGSSWRPARGGVGERAVPEDPRAKRPGSAGARVCCGVHVAEGVRGDQGVDLRRGHRGVAEQLLHDAHIRPSGEKVRRKGVPEGVR